MFEALKNFIKGVIGKLFNKNLIESKANVNIAVSADMSNAIDLWSKLYMDEAPWVNNKTVFSMNNAAGIASEFARLVTLEFKSEISNNEFLNKEYQAVIDNIRNSTEFACAKGGLVFKPYLSGNHIEVDTTQADSFFPTTYNSRGDITGAIFIETKTSGDYTYTRLEYHNLTPDGYLIKNLAFKKKNLNQINGSLNNQTLGEEISLTEIDEWAELEPEVTIQNIDRPLFSYFKMPLANIIDPSSPLGVSVYSRVSNDLLKKADEQYSRIEWEFRGSELAIDASRDLFKRQQDGTYDLPEGKERLYRKLDIEGREGTSQYNVFSPAIRDVSLYNGLQHMLRTIEFQCGLAYGTLSDPNETDKTAEEIKSSKQRSYQTVKDIQKSLQNALEGLAYAMSVWGQLGSLGVSPIDTEKDMSFDFDDSIVVDKEKELASMQADVASGLLRPEIYVAKKYGVSEEEAIKMMPDTSLLVNNSPFDGTTE